MAKAIGAGILWTFLGLFPAALLVAAVYHVPVPFVGLVGGREMLSGGPPAVLMGIWIIVKAVLFYTAFGGFVIIAALGTIAGVIGRKLGGPDRASRYVRNIGLAMAFVPVIGLSVLDKFIGPW